MLFASICEHASREFIFATTSNVQFCHASSEHFSNYKWWAATSASLIFRQLNLSFIKTLFSVETPSKHANRRKARQPYSQQLEPIMPCLKAVWYKITSLSFKRVSGWTLNGIWSFLRPCLQASRFPLKRVKDRPYYLGRNSGRSVSINVN